MERLLVCAAGERGEWSEGGAELAHRPEDRLFGGVVALAERRADFGDRASLVVAQDERRAFRRGELGEGGIGAPADLGVERPALGAGLAGRNLGQGEVALFGQVDAGRRARGGARRVWSMAAFTAMRCSQVPNSAR